jgi:hypothetical protein
VTPRRRAESLGTLSKVAFALAAPSAVVVLCLAAIAAPFVAVIILWAQLKRAADAAWNDAI